MKNLILIWSLLFTVNQKAISQNTIIEQALKIIKEEYFSYSDDIIYKKYILTDEEKSFLKESHKIFLDSIDIILALTSQKIVGCGIINNIKGKSLPITYLTVLDTDGNIIDIYIMKYRETHGGEIQNKSFRKQFQGKNFTSSLEIGKDIKSISGATISSHSITIGVKNTLIIFNTVKDNILDVKTKR